LLADTGAGAAGTVVISAIGGTAGVGKTALALHWAHEVADQFPDGQLHVNLRGFDPSGTPATAAEAIRWLLDALGVPADQIPRQLDAQTGLYRSLMAGRRMMIVLDNARNEAQVRALLPGSQASLVLVTSRNQLAGLAVDGARLLSLDVLTHAEAVELLIARLGSARTTAEPAAVDQIVRLCACLPLALAVTAARAVTRPGFPLAALADELAGSADRLDALDAGDPAASVRAVFSWSTRQLSEEPARMFRLLGLHPGPDISVPAAASLAGTDEPRARRLLRELARVHLIAEHFPGRYALHDLLRAYATEQAEDTIGPEERAAAVGRVLDHYLHTAAAAALLHDASGNSLTLAPSRPGVTPEKLVSRPQAVLWFEAEHQVLLAAVLLAAQSRFDAHAWQIPWTMADFLDRRGHWQQWAAIQRTAIAAASRVGDIAGQAESHRRLANACTMLADLDQARVHLGDCLELYRQLGDEIGEAKTHQSLAMLADLGSRYADALDHAGQALRLYQAAGNQIGQAEALNNVGYCHAQLGDHQQARSFCQQSLTLSRAIGHRPCEVYAWDSLGFAEHHLGHHAEAVDCYRRALSLLPELGDRFSEAVILDHLGDARQAAGDRVQAREAWMEAMAIFEDLQRSDADGVRGKLSAMDAEACANQSG
jgi:tetratricopeptide (TPR) repeat protein